MDLARRIAARGSEFLFFALTPPRTTVSSERAQQIADVTRRRLAGLQLDGLVLYDIDDESERNQQERPFPFLPTMDPATFRARHLKDWSTPVVVYRAVGKYEEDDLRSWLEAQGADESHKLAEAGAVPAPATTPFQEALAGHKTPEEMSQSEAFAGQTPELPPSLEDRMLVVVGSNYMNIGLVASLLKTDENAVRAVAESSGKFKLSGTGKSIAKN